MPRYNGDCINFRRTVHRDPNSVSTFHLLFHSVIDNDLVKLLPHQVAKEKHRVQKDHTIPFVT